jgi:hypothetical protein
VAGRTALRFFPAQATVAFGAPPRVAFASEVTRVAREVGTEGKLGRPAQVLAVVRRVAVAPNGNDPQSTGTSSSQP